MESLMTSRTMRWTARVGVAALAVGIAAPTAWAATWSPSPSADKTVGTAGKASTWNYGSSFAKLANGDVAMTYTTDADANANSPQSTYALIGDVDGTTKAVTWGAPFMTSQAATKADRTSLATGGDNVHAVFVKQHAATVTDITKPRVGYVRSNVGGTWGAPVAISPAQGRVDYPIVAASGDSVYVAYTNAANGKVTVKRSVNAGATFPSTSTVGTTTRNDGEGLAAWPITCASGSNVGIAWLKGDGTIKLSVSKNGGGTYATKNIPAVGAGSDDEGWASCDATGNRIGVTWNEDDGVYYTEYSTGSNSFVTPRTNIFPFSGSGYLASYSGTVALTGTSKVGIAAPLCVQDGCDYTANTTRIDLKWLESSNKGGTFAAAEAVANATAPLSGGKTLNDSPSAMWYDATTRFVLYNGWTANYNNYRLYLSTGTG